MTQNIMEFKNEYKSTRSGFSHITRLYDNEDNLLAVEKRDYLNRTWEVYPFQSSMRGAVTNAINNEIQRQKTLQGIKRLTEKKRAEICAYSSIINQLKTLYQTL